MKPTLNREIQLDIDQLFGKKVQITSSAASVLSPYSRQYILQLCKLDLLHCTGSGIGRYTMTKQQVRDNIECGWRKK
ncbi:hypothetical protein Dip510_000855 [Elusimicrobium posterum]|uniref:hypothetical protein n=1 Tax=Elusimicrobium posterum TaxID=3116653 RepID=UPI003C7915C2